MNPKVELVFFEGCPHVDEARRRVQGALQEIGAPASWQEWDTIKESTPASYRRFGSPTVLVDGRDVSGDAPGGGMRCVVGGAPAMGLIVAALRGGGR